MMTRELVAELLGLKPPWQVKEVVARPEAGQVVIEVDARTRAWSVPNAAPEVRGTTSVGEGSNTWTSWSIEPSSA